MPSPSVRALIVPLILWSGIFLAIGWLGAEGTPANELPAAAKRLAFSDFGHPLARWDAGYYLAIAEHGYQRPDQAAFWPGYPALLRALHLFVPLPWPWLGAVVSFLGFGVGLMLLRQLAVIHEKRLENPILALALTAPTAFIFLTSYSEGLFWLAGALVLWAEKKRPVWAVAGAVVATVTRPYGLLLALPVARTIWKNGRRLAAVGCLTLCLVTAAGSTALISRAVHQDLAPFASQSRFFGRSLGFDVTELRSIIENASTESGAVSRLLLVNVTVGIIAGTASLFGLRRRFGWTWTFTTAAVLLAAIGLGTVQSSHRIIFAWPPVIVGLTLVLNRFGRTIAFSLGGVLLLLNSVLFSLWYYVA